MKPFIRVIPESPQGLSGTQGPALRFAAAGMTR